MDDSDMDQRLVLLAERGWAEFKIRHPWIAIERNDADFTCAICGKFQAADNIFCGGGFRVMAPICVSCERNWGRANPLLDGAGAYADRRVAIQIKALAAVIDCSAYCQQGGHAQPYSEKENSK